MPMTRGSWQSSGERCGRMRTARAPRRRRAFELEAIRWQYVTGVSQPDMVDPDTWVFDHALLQREGNDRVQLALFRDYATNPPLYPAVHEYFRTTQVPLLAIWGAGDRIFGPEGARAFANDLPNAEIHLLDGGHFLLESELDTAVGYIRGFLGRTLSGPSGGRSTPAGADRSACQG